MTSGPLEKSSNILAYDMSTAQVINARHRKAVSWFIEIGAI